MTNTPPGATNMANENPNDRSEAFQLADPVELLERLSPQEIRQRIQHNVAENDALRVLLKAVVTRRARSEVHDDGR